MTKTPLLAVLTVAAAASWAFPEERKDLTRVTVPDNNEAALKVIKAWLDARGIETETRKGVLVMKKLGVLMTLQPIVHKGELDRLRVAAYYHAKEERKGTKELEQLAVKLNRSQNFLQVFVDGDGDLAACSNLTFYDELTARHFDAFVDAFAQIVKRYVLTEEALKMLK
jgi:hypothetical protein